MMTAQAGNLISVLIVDDHPTLRAGVRSILESTPDIYVIGEAGNGSDAEDLVRKLHPKVILLDLKMPGFSPSAFEKWTRENYPETTTLVLTAHDRDFYLAEMMDTGVAAYLSKTERTENLIIAIRRAANGEVFFTPEQIRRARKWRSETAQKWEKLTEREREVIQLMEQGMSNKLIAKHLDVTPKTVAYHISAIFERLDVKSRHEAIAWYRNYFSRDLE